MSVFYNHMTSKERMKITMKNGIADRVPVAPDMSNMIPCKLTGKPFWSVYMDQNPPLWQAYLQACKHFDIDGWFIYDGIKFRQQEPVHIKKQRIKQSAHQYDELITVETKFGDLTSRVIYPDQNPPTTVDKYIKNLKSDFSKIKSLFSPITGYDKTEYEEMNKQLGDSGIMAQSVAPPGLHIFHEYFQGNLEAAIFAYYDEPDLFLELCSIFEQYETQKLEIMLDIGVESILTGGSGSITMQSPGIWEELSFPAIKKYTRMCRQAGAISGIHSCGKEAYIVKKCAEETDLDYINPLEVAPMGDCDLRSMHKDYGARLCLMGNLHTTNVMLFGTNEYVKLKSLEAIRDAGQNGGFVLSTGDQCGKDTPEINIRTMVDTVCRYGRYPLDLDMIDNEINRLNKLSTFSRISF